MEYEEANDELCQLDIDDVREDFEVIWFKNVIEVLISRDANSSAGDYFNEDDVSKTGFRKMKLNIQGISSNLYRRGEQGLVTAGQTYKAYARWNEDVQNKDIIIWDKQRFVIKNHNKSLYEGQVCHQEFDLARVDKVDG